jgi:hypothetical protein
VLRKSGRLLQRYFPASLAGLSPFQAASEPESGY